MSGGASSSGQREASLGITEYLTPGPGFTAITKQRFTDFIVREISSDLLLSRYSVIVIDEAHERGVNTDLLPAGACDRR